MKLLKFLSENITTVLNVVATLSGISSLVFSGVTWTNLEDTKVDIVKHHDELKNIVPTISDLTQYKNSSNFFLKRLDKDIELLFRDLGRSNERSEIKTDMLLMLFEKNKNKTNGKISDNMLMIENYYKNLNSRLIYARKIIDDNTKNMAEMNRKVIKNIRDLKVLKIFLRKHTKNETM